MKELLIEIKETLARHDEKFTSQGEVLKRIDDNVKDMDKRLRGVEMSSATTGGITGGIVAIGIAYITQKLRGV